MKTSTKVMGGDLGAGATKIRSASGTFGFPSTYGLATGMMAGFNYNQKNAFFIRVDDQELAIGETAHFEGLSPITEPHISRIETNFYKIMFAAAMALGVQNSGVVQPILSLPPKYYASQKELQKDRICGDYDVDVYNAGSAAWEQRHYEVPRDLIRIVPEGFGAVCAMTLGSDGKDYKDLNYHKETIGILDVGTFTTDFVMLDALNLVKNKSDSIDVGLNQIRQAIDSDAISRGVTLQQHQLDIALRKEYFQNGSERVDIATILYKQGEYMARAISAKLNTLWDHGKAVEKIIVVGGGAKYVIPWIQGYYNHALLIETKDGVAPYNANAEGNYRFGVMMNLKGR